MTHTAFYEDVVVFVQTDLVPPIDMVIRTNWPGSSVDWNGTDPIL